MRTADGPISTPRRAPPRSSGTPMMWTGFTGGTRALLEFVRHGHSLAGWRHHGGEERGVALNGFQKRLHLALLVHDIVRGEHSASCLLYTSDAADERSSVDLG